MWKRLPLRDRGNRGKEIQQIQIGAPALLESTYDPQQLDRAQDLSPTAEQQYGYHNPDIRPSRARQDVENQLKLPSLNFTKQPSSQNPATYHQPHHSVAASSIYSQADMAVSPPSSPARRPVADDGQVSPIEEHPSYGMNNSPKPSQRRESNIPVPRKATPSSAARGPPQNVPRTKEWTQRVGQEELKWDPMYGEPVVDGGVKGSSVKPGEFDFRAGLRPSAKLQGIPTPSTAAEPQKAGFRERASRFAQKGLAIDTRPPWKGASGRHAIPEPPKDVPGQIVPQPRREDGRVKSPENTPLSSGPPPTGRNVAYPSETPQVAASSSAQGYQEQSIKPIMPSQDASRRQIYESPVTSAQYKPDGHSSPDSPTDRSVTPTQEHPYSSTTAHSGDRIVLPKNDSRAYADKNSPPRRTRTNSQSGKFGESPEQPGSRFSWTTTATSTYQHSPPPSPPPPMPAAYLNSNTPTPVANRSPNSSPTGVTSSILDRGHPTRRMSPVGTPPSPPMSGRSFSAGSTLRKPVGSTLAVQPPSPEPQVIHQAFPMTDWRAVIKGKQRAASLAPSTFSTTSASKVLPKTPQELSSADLITTLQAQQSDLATQRRNIQRLIADLEKPEAKNPLTNSFKMIRENEKRLIGLKEELDEVMRRDYDCGMRMHRAWKRREREDPNTPGSIFWVRRATAGD